MTIREATESDIPSIVDLLKSSLGESLIPKSEKLWKWKHLSNPFGQSPVLVAESDGRLIGVRAFLRWEYVWKGDIIPAYRAVDTAIHPDFQGKGFFKKLTLALVEKVSHESKILIFNTPNQQSAPGYLKMGWQEWGKLPLCLGVNLRPTIPSPEKVSWEGIEGLVKELENSPISQRSQTSTNLKSGYLNWRYRDCPIVSYQTVTDRETFLVIYREKSSKVGKEFRICDLLQTKNSGPKEVELMNKMVRDAVRSSNCRLVTYSGLQAEKHLNFIRMARLPLGPLVMLRQVHPDLNPLNLDWRWSLGDLEVF